MDSLLRVQRVRLIKKTQDFSLGVKILSAEKEKLHQLKSFIEDYDFSAIESDQILNVGDLKNRALFVGVIHSALIQQDEKVEKIKVLHDRLLQQYFIEKRKQDIYEEFVHEKNKDERHAMERFSELNQYYELGEL